MAKRKLKESVKKKIAGRQFYQCANRPNSNLRGLEGYNCPLWTKPGNEKGNFDEGGYEIDHIIEHSISQNDNEDNLQALCTTCHKVKTKRFLSNNNCNKKNTKENNSSLNAYQLIFSTINFNNDQTNNDQINNRLISLLDSRLNNLSDNNHDNIYYTCKYIARTNNLEII